MRERSRAKSSAAKMRPERRGVARQMEVRFEMDLADSMRARILTWEDLRVRKSAVQVRSAGEFTLGMTMVSRFGALQTWERSFSGRPLSIELMRTATSLMPGPAGCSRK